MRLVTTTVIIACYTQLHLHFYVFNPGVWACMLWGSRVIIHAKNVPFACYQTTNTYLTCNQLDTKWTAMSGAWDILDNVVLPPWLYHSHLKWCGVHRNLISLLLSINPKYFNVLGWWIHNICLLHAHLRIIGMLHTDTHTKITIHRISSSLLFSNLPHYSDIKQGS